MCRETSFVVQQFYVVISDQIGITQNEVLKCRCLSFAAKNLGSTEHSYIAGNNRCLVGHYGEPLVIHGVNVSDRIFDFLFDFGGLGGVPIDRKLPGDRFGRILSPGSGIIVQVRLFSWFHILTIQNPRSWGYFRDALCPWNRFHEHMPMEPVP